MVNRDIPVAPYRQLAGILRGQIASGALAGKLPAERYLAQQYDVALNTVRKALQLLRDEGLIVTEHALGSFVVRQPGGQ